MKRERYDGADIMHLLHAWGERLHWPHLLDRFGSHWRVLLSYLILYGFVYPTDQARIPAWVMQDLVSRCQTEEYDYLSRAQICQGTLLSRAQYRVDIAEWGYGDARLMPTGRMTAGDIAHWTAAIAGEGGAHDHPEGVRAHRSRR